MKEDAYLHKLFLRFVEILKCTSNFRESVREMLHEMRTHTHKRGDTISDTFEHKHDVLTLELNRDIIQDNHLDNFFVAGMKHYSWITE